SAEAQHLRERPWRASVSAAYDQGGELEPLQAEEADPCPGYLAQPGWHSAHCLDHLVVGLLRFGQVEAQRSCALAEEGPVCVADALAARLVAAREAPVPLEVCVLAAFAQCRV